MTRRDSSLNPSVRSFRAALGSQGGPALLGLQAMWVPPRVFTQGPPNGLDHPYRRMGIGLLVLSIPVLIGGFAHFDGPVMLAGFCLLVISIPLILAYHLSDKKLRLL